jgi:hypothetical protein
LKELVVHMAHQALNHHHTHQVLEEVPVDSVSTVVLLAVSVVAMVHHHTNPQLTDQVELVVLLVLMLLLPHLTVPTRTKMAVLMLMNSNNSTKAVYKQNKLPFLFFTHFFTLIVLYFSFSF